MFCSGMVDGAPSPRGARLLAGRCHREPAMRMLSAAHEASRQLAFESPPPCGLSRAHMPLSGTCPIPSRCSGRGKQKASLAGAPRPPLGPRRPAAGRRSPAARSSEYATGRSRQYPRTEPRKHNSAGTASARQGRFRREPFGLASYKKPWSGGGATIHRHQEVTVISGGSGPAHEVMPRQHPAPT